MGSTSTQCAMRDTCGKTSMFGAELPCPYDGPAQEPDDRQLLVDVCGPEFASGPTCCTSDQVKTLRDNFVTVDRIISSCPACRNNFHSFFCTFTCSPNQGSFVNITSTQKTTSSIAVKSLDFHVEEAYGKGFFDSCKSVQMGAANQFAMDFIGGGAKNYTSFFKFLGDKKPIGSPFQIDFPLEAPSPYTPLNITARSCSDNDLSSRCTCVDCPDVCLALPYLPPPSSESTCRVGVVSCLTFSLTLVYSIGVLGFLVGLFLEATIRKRREKRYERVALSAETASLSSRPQGRGLVGAGSLAHASDDDSTAILSENRRLGRGISLVDPIQTQQPRQYPLNSFLRRSFYRLGLFTASSPWLTFSITFLVFGLLNIGWKRFAVETDPVRLWVSPNSETKQQKEYFDEQFGPFYRPQQIFITSTNTTQSGAKEPVLSWDHLKYWSHVEEHIRTFTSPSGYTLNDVCFKPAGEKGACVVQSVMGWFGNDLDDYSEATWAEHLQECAASPVECLPDFQQPLGAEFVVGGVPKLENGAKDYLKAEALVVTFVLQNSLDDAVISRAMEWEQTLRAYLEQLATNAPAEAGLNIAFSTGVSLEEEIGKSSNTDVRIVILSYLAMFLYVALTLGSGSGGLEEDSLLTSLSKWARRLPQLFSRSRASSSSLSVDSDSAPSFFPRLPRSLFIGSKFFLGLFGISLVILSVSSSVGLFSLLNVKVTLVIAEVIPFLVLAVGVDNVFILVHELDRQTMLHGPNAASQGSQGGLTSPLSPTAHRSTFTSSTGEDDVDAVSVPLYLSAEERVARSLAKMGPSILLSTITETFAFGLGALVPMPAVRNFALYAAGSVLLNAILQVTVFMSAMYLDLRRVEANRVDCFPCIRLPSRIALSDAPATQSLGRIARFIRRTYAPFLLRPEVKGVVGLIFSGIFVGSVISIQHIELGLDQRLALPSDSYLVSYFNHLDQYLDIGPPVYFVAKGVDVTERKGQQKLCGRFTTCQAFSMANILEGERKRTNVSFISQPSAAWVDTFFEWLNPEFDQCCRVRKDNPEVFCPANVPASRCRPCFEGKQPAWNVTMDGFPENEDFMKYLKQWISYPTTEDCPAGGKAPFGTALSIDDKEKKVVASHFRTFHSPLKSQSDFINSFAAARRVADDISERIGEEVFPYSLHYVFFDQYAHIAAITQEVLGLGLGAVLLVTAVFLGSWRTAFIVTATVGLTVVNVMGVMAIWGISLNAISLVNLVISLGIAVEFCAHVARAFMSAGSGLPIDHPAGQKERDERMWTALVDVGPSVLSGITFTKLIGMSVLALTKSRLLEIYYFRMWFTLIISGALHGLVCLPVLLSVAGGPGFPQQEADEEWMTNVIRNDYEYAPFLADDDSMASD